MASVVHTYYCLWSAVVRKEQHLNIFLMGWTIEHWDLLVFQYRSHSLLLFLCTISSQDNTIINSEDCSCDLSCWWHTAFNFSLGYVMWHHCQLLLGFRMLNLGFIPHGSWWHEALTFCIVSVQNSVVIVFLASLCTCQHLWHPTSTVCGIAKLRAYSQEKNVNGLYSNSWSFWYLLYSHSLIHKRSHKRQWDIKLVKEYKQVLQHTLEKQKR
jgi:hypothetical protein